MKKVKKIYYQKKLIAIVFPHDLTVDKIKFFTQQENPFQIGLHQRPKGEILPAHIHRIPKTIKIRNIQELLYVQKGKIRVTLFTKEGKIIRKVDLCKDDSILLISQGHGVEILKKARIFELKQGPYFGAKHAKVYYKIEP